MAHFNDKPTAGINNTGGVIVPSKLPHFLRDMLEAPPHRGEGLHNYIFRVARQLHAHGTEEHIVNFLEQTLSDCGAERGEIAEAVRNSKAVAWDRRGTSRPIGCWAKRWPSFDAERHAAAVANKSSVSDFRHLSQQLWTSAVDDPEVVIDLLFTGDPLLCCAEAKNNFATKPREKWRGTLAQMQFIVPSPMARPYGRTKTGRTSSRCLDNVGPRRFLVVEFDQGSLDDQAALLAHLAGYAPLALIVHSGGKSLHGWFFCDNQPEQTVRHFASYAVQLGADPATYVPCQQVRMPAGRRDNGNRQEVLFLHPEVIA